jgi:Ca2+-binding EF-hand superfamily protein
MTRKIATMKSRIMPPTLGLASAVFALGLAACEANSPKPVERASAPLKVDSGTASRVDDGPKGRDGRQRPRGPGRGLSRMFERLDADGDGVLTEQEAGKRWRFFSAADSDGDLSVTLAEVEAAQESGALRRKMRERRRADRGKGERNGASFLERFDTNGDGVVQLSELPEHKREWLAAADTDGDGAISKEELRAHFERLKERTRPRTGKP